MQMSVEEGTLEMRRGRKVVVDARTLFLFSLLPGPKWIPIQTVKKAWRNTPAASIRANRVTRGKM